MSYKLGKNVEVGNRILLKSGWKKIISKTESGVITNDGDKVLFDSEIFGWKIK